MAQNQRNRIVAYSYAFYNRMSYNEIAKYDEGGLKDEHRKLIGDTHYSNLKKFCAATIEDQRKQLAEKEQEIVEAHLEALFLLDTNPEVLAYILPSLDGILYESPSAASCVIKVIDTNKNRSVIQKLQKIVASRENSNTIINDSSARILAALISDHGNYHRFMDDIRIFVNFLVSTSLKAHKNLSDYLVVVCLSHVLLVPGMTKYFGKELGGTRILKQILNNHSNDLQIMYYTFLDIWIMSFEPSSQKDFADPTLMIIKNVITALKNISREKLSRIAFKLFKNISGWSDCVELMVDHNLTKVVESEMRKNLKDKDLKENLYYLSEVLEANYKILSSYEKYVKEINTEQLNWGPCHSEKFWKQNVSRFAENNYSLIGKLVRLLENPDEITQAIACYDLGEFCRFYPFARNILDKNEGKNKLMHMIKNSSGTVREQALLATQKMMIHNWQNLKI